MKLSDYALTDLEGGFIHIRAKAFRGTIRTREDKRIVWKCKHNHYRPEYNARYTQDLKQVWEASALNCGRAAYAQLLEGAKRPKGFPGLVGDPAFPLEERDDVRFVRVGNQDYYGRVSLTDNGQRVLEVKLLSAELKGALNLDVGVKKGLTLPPTTSVKTLHDWATALWLLKGTVWGVIFQDASLRMEAKEPIKRAVEEILRPDEEKLPAKARKTGLSLPETYESRTSSRTSRPKAGKKATKKLSPKSPHVNPVTRKGKRVFEVVDWDGGVVDTFVHRGKAMEALAKVKEKAR
jgi:hypothetical protein